MKNSYIKKRLAILVLATCLVNSNITYVFADNEEVVETTDSGNEVGQSENDITISSEDTIEEPSEGTVETSENSADTISEDNVNEVSENNINTVSDNNSISANFISENEIMATGGYIITPWDYETTVVDDNIPFEESKENIVTSDEDNINGIIADVDAEECVGGIAEITATSEEIPSAYPYGYSNTSELNNYFSNTLMPTRDQGQHGLCWAHSALSMIEGATLLNNHSDKNGAVNRNIDYSEMQLAYSCFHENLNPITGTNGGDRFYRNISNDKSFLQSGGNYGFAAQALMNWRGPVNESLVPYSFPETYKNSLDISNPDDAELYDKFLHAETGINEEYQYGHELTHLTNMYQFKIKENPNLVKQAVLSNEFVGIIIGSYHLGSSNSGDYNSDTSALFHREYATPDHTVVIVGWDDDFPVSNFGYDSIKKHNMNDEPEGPISNGAWLVRNSWQASENPGLYYKTYFWVSYHDQSISPTAYVYEVEQDDYDNNYFYTNQLHGTLDGSSRYNKIANVFTISGKGNSPVEKLSGIAVHVAQGNSPYKMSILAVGDDGKPTDIKLINDITGVFPYTGMYTIPIEENLYLERGQKFAVAFTKDTTNKIPIYQEYSVYDGNSIKDYWNIGYNSIATANIGESFCITNNRPGIKQDTWYDITDDGVIDNYKIKNFCINAFTSDASDVYTSSKFNFTANSNEVYNGKTHNVVSITPKSEISGGTPTVYYRLTDNDSEWTTDKPVNAGTYMVAIDYPAIGGYRKAEKLSSPNWIFNIKAKDIALTQISGVTNCDYTGQPVIPNMTVTDTETGKTLVKDIDYTVNNISNWNVGNAKVAVKGIGNYCGETEVTFTIESHVSKISISKKELTMSFGDTESLTAEISPYNATNRKCSWYSTNSDVISINSASSEPYPEVKFSAIKPGTSKIYVETEDSNKTDYCEITVNKKDISSDSISIGGDGVGYDENTYDYYIYDYNYTGKPIKINNFKITHNIVKPGSYYYETEYKELVENVDYSIEYKNNIEIGTATVIIKGKGNYCGTKVYNFNIVKSEGYLDIISQSPIYYGQTLGDVQIEYKAYVWSGYEQVEISGNIAFEDPSIKPYTSNYYYANGDYNSKDYTVIFTPSDKHYNSISYNCMHVDVLPADLDISIEKLPDITYGETLNSSDIHGNAKSKIDSSVVSGNFIVDSDFYCDAQQNYTVKMHFEPDDKYNFIQYKTFESTININKATPTVSSYDQAMLDQLTLSKGGCLGDLTHRLPANFRWADGVDTSKTYNTIGENIKTTVIYNPNTTNYYDKQIELTIPVVDPSSIEVQITTTNCEARINGTVVTQAKQNDILDVIAIVPNGKKFSHWSFDGVTVYSYGDKDGEAKFKVNTNTYSATITAELIGAENIDEPFDPASQEEPPKKEEFTGKIKKFNIKYNGKAVKSINIKKGDTLELLGYVEMTKTMDNAPAVHFRTENSQIVRITDTGKLTGYKQGITNIIAYCGNKTAKCKITVVDDINGCSISIPKDKVYVGEQVVLKAYLYPEGSVANRTVTWSAKPAKAASIVGNSNGGVLTAKKEGTVTVTVTIKTTDTVTGKKTSFTESKTVEVVNPDIPPVSSSDKSYKLSFKKKNIKISNIGKQDTVTAVLSKAEKADSVSIDWFSSNESVVTVCQSSGKAHVDNKKAFADATISACGIGYAYIIAKVTDNTTGLVNVNRCKVTVANDITEIKIYKDSLDKLENGKIELRKGQKEVLFINTEPYNPSNINRITWSATGGVTVKNGVIYATKVTTKPATVTVKCGKVKDTITVVVTK